MNNPKVYFSLSAFKRTCFELSRWYEIGVKKKGKPFEAALFPFSYVVLKSEKYKSPIEIISVNDISSVVVPYVAIPHDKIKNFSENKANFKVKGVDNKLYWDLFTRQKVAPVIGRYPLLSIISRLHSHPFSRHSKHSAGDKNTFNKDEVFARDKGFGMSFSFLATPLDKEKKTIRWEIVPYLVGFDGSETKLEMFVVKDSHREIIRSKRQPFYKQSQGQKWEKQFIKIIDILFKRTRIMRKTQGWTSYWFKDGLSEYILLLPPFFPEEPLKLYVSSNGDGFIEKKLDHQVSPEIKDIKPERLIEKIVS